LHFKVDENLPAETCQMLRQAGHDAVSVLDQQMGGRPDSDIASVCQSESRALVTLDTDFANIIAYPPEVFPGIVVIRTDDQAKPAVLALMQRFLTVLSSERLDRHLWIVEDKRIRIRGAE
jgi:predicted nuclease of predicted toxin-antitoxin system